MDEDKDFQDRNQALRPSFALHLPKDEPKREEQDDGVQAMQVEEDQGPEETWASGSEKAKKRSGAMILEDEGDEKAEDKKPSTSRRSTTKQKGSPRGKSKTAAAQVPRLPLGDFDEDEEQRNKDEDAAISLSLALDKSQYFPILLDYDRKSTDEEDVSAKPSTGTSLPLRQDMNGITRQEKQIEESDLLSFGAQDGQELVENGNNFVLFQFPVELPELPKESIEDQGMAKIGKLQIFSDGSAEMKVGGIALDVSTGILSECRHEIGLFSTIEEECLFLGSIASKQVCTPSLNYLFD